MSVIKTLYLEQVLNNHSQNMLGKTVAITGTTSGTGYIAARELARKGAEVLLLNRQSIRSETAYKKLKQEVLGGRFIEVECDLQNMANVDQAIAKIKSRIEVLDVLCNNAAVMALEDQATSDGYDIQVQTNVLSHFQLVKGLMPLLKASKGARIINHTSMARLGGPLQPEFFGKNGGNLGGDGTQEEALAFGGPRWERYHQTKLANFVFTYALNNRLEAAGIENVMCVAAHPGLALTSLAATSAKSGGMDANAEFMKQSQSAEDGATGIIRAAMDPKTKAGDFYGPDQWKGFPKHLTPESDLVTDENIEVFWQGCEKAIGELTL